MLRNLFLFVVFSAVSYCRSDSHIKSKVYLYLLSTMPIALFRSVNNYLLDKFMHDLGSKFRDMLILLHYLYKGVHISTFLLCCFNKSSKL